MAGESLPKKNQESNPSFASAEKLADFLSMLSKDRVPAHIHLDAAYVVGETSDNQKASAEGAIDLYKAGRTSKIVVCRGPMDAGYCGANYIRNILSEAGVTESDIVETNLGETNVNTASEAQAFIRLCKEHQWNNVVAAAPQFHYQRAFVTMVTAALDQGMGDAINIWIATGKADPWKDEALHSQGKVRATRIKLLQGEIDRLYKYVDKSTPQPLQPLSVIEEYMARRDQRTKQPDNATQS